jgi:hypothetical protein
VARRGSRQQWGGEQVKARMCAELSNTFIAISNNLSQFKN